MSTQIDYITFQKNLISARHSVNLTQQQVAERLSKPQSYVSKYESGERRLDVVEFLDVCKALNLEPHIILKIMETKNG